MIPVIHSTMPILTFGPRNDFVILELEQHKPMVFFMQLSVIEKKRCFTSSVIQMVKRTTSVLLRYDKMR